MKKQIIVVPWETPQIDTAKIQSLLLWKDGNGEPCMRAETETEEHIFPLTRGVEIHNCDNFLRSLDLGIDVHFEKYTQYGMLIWECSELLEMENAPCPIQ